MSTTILVIGIGVGNPEHMTVQAIGALNRADIVLVPRKGPAKDDLAELRRNICKRFLTNSGTRLIEFDMPVRDAAGGYHDGVERWHDAIAALYRTILAQELPGGGTAAMLVWGDPSLYDSTLRILARLRGSAGSPIAVEMVPGITAVQSLAASHAVPLNGIGGSVLITTGRKLREAAPDPDMDTIVVMLDGDMAFRSLPGEAYEIFWSAYLGFPEEISVAGVLCEVRDEIARIRNAARERHGWLMDVYMLRRIR